MWSCRRVMNTVFINRSDNWWYCWRYCISLCIYIIYTYIYIISYLYYNCKYIYIVYYIMHTMYIYIYIYIYIHIMYKLFYNVKSHVSTITCYSTTAMTLQWYTMYTPCSTWTQQLAVLKPCPDEAQRSWQMDVSNYPT